MSGLTLQRHLAGEGTTFERLLDDTRRELSQQYLGQTDVSLADATYLLGSEVRAASSARASAGLELRLSITVSA
jgi:hypothetical protein